MNTLITILLMSTITISNDGHVYLRALNLPPESETITISRHALSSGSIWVRNTTTKSFRADLFCYIKGIRYMVGSEYLSYKETTVMDINPNYYEYRAYRWEMMVDNKMYIVNFN